MEKRNAISSPSTPRQTPQSSLNTLSKEKEKLLSDDVQEAEEGEAVKIARREALARILRDDLKTPYLTCQRCNSVTFINVNRVRSRLGGGGGPAADKGDLDAAALSDYEQLPLCSGCGTTKYLRAGVVSVQDKIEAEKLKIKEFEKHRVPATHLLVRIARGFLGRLAFRRRKREHELYLSRIHVAATRIQARVYGMQARKRIIYERCLRIIRTLHSSIFQHALAARPDRPPVFWYDHPGELQILYWNYREFVRRTGGKPPLFKVESNIMEITRRMLLREHELVSRIQSRWRGLTTRLVYVEFKRQRGWLNGIHQSPAIKIQRLYRAHVARRRCTTLRAVKKNPDHMEVYQQERAAVATRQAASAFREKLLSKYRLSYQTDKTCKMMALQMKPEGGEAGRTGDAQQHVQFSLNNNQRIPVQAATQSASTQHPNARKLAQMKRLVRSKHQRLVRGPRLHILNAQEFAAAREENDT